MLEINELKKIAVISDTHIPTRASGIPKKAAELMCGSGLIIHCGDIVANSVLKLLSSLSPVVAVKGNMDSDEIDAPIEQVIKINGRFTLCIAHGSGSPVSIQPSLYKKFIGYSPDLIIHGHTHVPYISEYRGIGFFNPGSCTAGLDYNSMGFMEIDESSIKPRIISL